MGFRSDRPRPIAALVIALVATSLAVLPQAAQATSSFSFTRLAGSDRFDTARVIAQATFATADTALIARADAFPDALAGNYLAGDRNAPILLTSSNDVPEATKSALQALKTSKVVLLGGTGAISQAVEDELKNTNSTSSSGGKLQVSRISGVDRYETAQKIAETPGAAAVGSVEGRPTAIVASGANFPDALAGGPLSYAKSLPTLLTEPSFLPAPTKTALSSLGIKLVQLLGGTGAVSRAVEDELSSMGITVNRIAGSDRTDTAARIAAFAESRLGFDKTHVNLARGDSFADALTGGPHAGEDLAPTLLTASATTLGTPTRDYLAARKADLTDGHIFGGESAVGQNVQDDAEAAAGAPRQVFSVSPTGAETKFASASGTTNEGARDCSATLRSGTPSVTIALFQAANVSTSGSDVKFVDNNRDGIADFNKKSTGAVIEKVNGADNPANPDENEVKSVPGSSGAVGFTIDSTSADDIVAVVFQDQTGNGLDVDATGAPTEPFGSGCRTSYIPPHAPAGARGVTVDIVNRNRDYFTGASTPTATNPSGSPSGSFTYFYDANDSFAYAGTTLTLAQFEGLLSKGDVLDVSYNQDPAAVSTFSIGTDTVASASNLAAVVINSDNESKPDDARITFILPTNVNGAETEYQITRARFSSGVQGTEGDAVCGTTDDDTASASGFHFVAKVTASPYLDLDVPDTLATDCYQWRIRSLNSRTGASAISNPTNTVTIPGAPEGTGLKAMDTRHTPLSATSGGTGSGNFDPREHFQVCFDRVAGLPTSATAMRLSDADGTVYDITNGENGRFYRIDTLPTGVTSAPAPLCPGYGLPGTTERRILIVELLGPPVIVSPGSTAGANIPSTIIAASQVTDEVGVPLDIQGSPDVIVDIEANGSGSPTMTGTQNRADTTRTIEVNFSEPIRFFGPNQDVVTGAAAGQFIYDDDGVFREQIDTNKAIEARRVDADTIRLTFGSAITFVSGRSTVRYDDDNDPSADNGDVVDLENNQLLDSTVPSS